MQRRMFRHVDNNCFICLWSSIIELLQPHAMTGVSKDPRDRNERFRKGFIYGPLFCQPSKSEAFLGNLQGISFFGDNKKFSVTWDRSFTRNCKTICDCWFLSNWIKITFAFNLSIKVINFNPRLRTAWRERAAREKRGKSRGTPRPGCLLLLR